MLLLCGHKDTTGLRAGGPGWHSYHDEKRHVHLLNCPNFDDSIVNLEKRNRYISQFLFN